MSTRASTTATEGTSVPELLKRFDPFAVMSESQRREIADLCELVYFPAGAAVCRVTESWRALYFVIAGRARLVDDRNAASPVTLDTVSQGGNFGERTVFDGEDGSFSAFAATELTLLRLPGHAFAAFLTEHDDIVKALEAQRTLAAVRGFLATCSAFSMLGAEDLALVAGALRPQQLRTGETLIREGDPAGDLFVVQQGSFRVQRAGTPEPLRMVKPGELIGEMAILTGARRNASIVAETDALVYTLPGAVFLRLVKQQKQFKSLVESTARLRTEAEHPEIPAELAQPESETMGAILEWHEPEYAGPKKRARVNVRQQSVMDCGAACLTTICLHYGKRVSLNSMRERARVGQAGASMLNLYHAAREIGFETIPVQSTYTHLQANHLPAIVNWGGYHWIVVYAIGDKVVVGDPGQGLIKLSPEEFKEKWTGYTLFMRPTPAFAALEEAPPRLEQFKRYVRPHRRMLQEIGLASFALQALMLVLPVGSKFVIDNVILKGESSWLAAALIALSTIMAVNLALNMIRQRILLYVSLKINISLLTDFYEHVLSLPIPYFESRKVGDIVTRFEENTKITRFFTETGVGLFVDMFAGVICLAVMLYYNIPMTAISLAFLTLHILNIRLLTPRVRHGYRELFQRYAELHSHTIEALNGLRTVRVLGIEHYIRWTWENLFTRMTNSVFTTIRYGLVSAMASQFVNSLSAMAVLFVGAYMVLENQLTVGELVAFTILANNLATPVTRVVGSWDQLQEAVNAVERVNDIYETRVEFDSRQSQDLTVLPTLSGHVRFEDLTFRYQPDGNNILTNINLDVRAGQRIAFVGRSGSGKSTLSKLLLGFYKPTSGRILVDGFELDTLWLPSMRRQIGVVPQESFLFHATIRENISQARPAASMAEVIAAAKLAAAHDFISALPEGYETLLEKEGSNLSGGQRQRLAIARCLIQSPRMLVLDEATSALDTETERVVMHNLYEAFPDRTMFMIAHRLSTVRAADKIVVLDRGNIIEMGNHQELMAGKGVYYLLSTQQLNL